uniref:methionine--tRNA ligase n=1 Tax=Albugo laibachii Nc14 TaxID=890382 RepID=F0WT45_9STRA|nr:unnamed protein product [Albugo laibachii Nc14]|eukprot:CCA24532.1 unnamed protein product [Albugo laibachii Nc14]
MSAVSVSMLRYAGCIPVHLSRRWYSSKLVSSVSNASNRRMMITTPIYYVNSSPHIGHLHSSVLADALARWYNMKKGPNSIDALLTTGTDEHGLKVQQAAEKANAADYASFCDAISNQFRELFLHANMDYTEFVRTSDSKHHRSVRAFWNQLYGNGYIYLGQHEAWYCQSDESFLTEMQVEDSIRSTAGPDGEIINETYKISKESGHTVEKLKEVNYKFRLSAFQQPLLEWLESSPDVIVPKTRYNEVNHYTVRATIKAGLRDISVSRLHEKIKWAITVPDDSQHCIYVWLDALTNYLTCAGYPDAEKLDRVWPPDYHIVGKDILKFHAIYWPAFLMAAGLPLPKRIVAHAHWTVKDIKMSKSLGNVVNPFEIIKKYGTDAVRYYLLREGVLGSDGDFKLSLLENRLSSELADTLGNLVSRSTARSFLVDGSVPRRPITLTPDDLELMKEGDAIAAKVAVDFQIPDFHQGLQRIILYLHKLNRYFSSNEPWVLKTALDSQTLRPAEAEQATERLQGILNITIDATRLCTILLQPAIPEAAERILDYLGVPRNERAFVNARFTSSDTSWCQRIENTTRFIPFRKYQCCVVP